MNKELIQKLQQYLNANAESLDSDDINTVLNTIFILKDV